MPGLKGSLGLAKATFKDFMDDEATWKAAALAYYTVFALPPLLVIILQVASFIWDPIEVRRTLTGQFQGLMGQDVAGQIQTMMESAEQKTSGGGLRLILSIAGLVFGATGAFVSLQTALNRAWGVQPDPKQGGIKNFIAKRMLSLGMLLGIAFLLLVSLALTAALSAAGGVLFGGLGETVGLVVNFVFSFAVITVLFAAMFKVLPDAKVAWRDVWVGAIATSILFVIGKYLIGLYVGQSNPGDAFGAAGSLAVLFIWIYYAAVIVLLGAEFTEAWIKHHGGTVEPEEGAVRVVEQKIEVDEPESAMAASGANPANRASEVKPESTDRSANGARVPDRKGKGWTEVSKHSGGAMSQQRESESRGKSETDKKSETAADVRREMAETRERMSQSVAHIGERMSERASDVKQKLDVTDVVRDHPWPALAAAVVAGVALSATRADAKAAGATVDAAKRVGHAAGDGAEHLREVAVQRLKGGDGKADASPEESRREKAAAKPAEPEKRGVLSRAKAAVGDAARAQAKTLESELLRAADELNGRR